MKKLIITILLLIFSSSGLISQPCLPEGIVFSIQYQIDSFPISYPNCTEIEGDVLIIGNYISNLTALSQITRINGDLTLQSFNHTTNFFGLHNLTRIGRDFKFRNNDSITDFTGLNQLEYIGRYFSIENNPALLNFEGLEALDTIASKLIIGSSGYGGNQSLCSLQGIDSLLYVEAIGIHHNPNLTNISSLQNFTTFEGGIFLSDNISLENLNGLHNIASTGHLYIQEMRLKNLNGLENLESITGGLLIGINDSLINISALSNLNSIGGEFNFGGNNKITNFNGLDGLISVGGNLMIVMNQSLTDFSGLENLSSLGGDLYVAINESLTSLYGLHNIDGNSIVNLELFWNPLLTECAILSICNYLLDPNAEYMIEGNGEGCSSYYEIMQDCEIYETQEQEIDTKNIIYPNPA
ncbi:MAG: hypothetical protein K8R53_12830, partial [Bacteroidales bacterium]|nr:hypothetical protein [Bacteroidales bacterium]